MNRSIANKIRFFLDEYLPPILRDNKYFMYPLFYIWYKGKNVGKLMEFKTVFHQLSDIEYQNYYLIQDSYAYDRPTDLSKSSINYIISKISLKDTILDVGCGRGYFLEILYKMGFHNLTGCDFIKPKDYKNFCFKEGTAENLPFEDKFFDIVVCSHTIEHLLDPKKGISEIIRVSREKIIITVPRQRWYKYSFDLHINFFPEKSYLIQLIGLDNYTCEDINGDWTYTGYLK